MSNNNTQLPLDAEAELCLLSRPALCILVVRAGQHMTVSLLMSLFIFGVMYIIPTAECCSVVCVNFSVVLLFTCCWLLLVARHTMASMMHCSGLHSSFVKCPFGLWLLVSGQNGLPGSFKHP